MIIWQCGILEEVVKSVVMAVYIAIFIKEITKEMLILMKLYLEQTKSLAVKIVQMR